jgi:hypothetical protein
MNSSYTEEASIPEGMESSVEKVTPPKWTARELYHWYMTPYEVKSLDLRYFKKDPSQLYTIPGKHLYNFFVTDLIGTPQSLLSAAGKALWAFNPWQKNSFKTQMTHAGNDLVDGIGRFGRAFRDLGMFCISTFMSINASVAWALSFIPKFGKTIYDIALIPTEFLSNCLEHFRLAEINYSLTVNSPCFTIPYENDKDHEVRNLGDIRYKVQNANVSNVKRLDKQFGEL